jgi:hypothetical protein
MFGERGKEAPRGEETNHTGNASTAQELIGRAVKGLSASYNARRDNVGEAIANEVQVAMTAPTLFPQLKSMREQRLEEQGVTSEKPNARPPTPGQMFISDLIIDIYQAYNTIKSIPELSQVLCSYMLHPQTEELECYFARELLQKHLLETKNCDSLTQDSTCLAEYLTRLRKKGAALKTNFEDQNLLSEIERLTTQPTLWLAVLDNVLECEKMGTKAYFVVQELKKNLSIVEEDPAVSEKLALLSRSNKASVLKRLRGLDTSDLELPSVDEFDLGVDEIY